MVTSSNIEDLRLPIIQSKLYPPPIAPDTVDREQLLSLAPAICGHLATIVSAPAGFGKSTLVTQCLERSDVKSAWLSLDIEDSDAVRFISYVVAALRCAYPGCCNETAKFLQEVDLLDTHALAGIFINDIEALKEPVVLVLDDYHHVSSTEIDDLLDFVLKHPPGNLHLVIVSRRNPNLSMPNLRGRGVLCEIRMQQLKFSKDETIAFARQQLGEEFVEDDIRVLHERTEGWPAAIRLAMLAARETGSTARIVDQLPKDSYSMRSYLMLEVLANQPREIREYALRTAFVDRFCPKLCEALIPADSRTTSGAEFVKYIAQANLFSIALDAGQNWFRFQHLFQAMLQDQALIELGEDVVTDIQNLASKWFEDNGFLEHAIQHAIRSSNSSAAADLISRHRNLIMNQELWFQLEGWLRMLDPQVLASRADLQLLKARIFLTNGQNSRLVETLNLAASLIEKTDMKQAHKDALHGSLASMRCYQLYLQADPERVVQEARRALDLLSPDDLAERGFATLMLSLGMQMSGDVKGARKTLHYAMTDKSIMAASGATLITRLHTSLCFVNWIDADLTNLELAAKDCVDLATQSGLEEVLSGGLHFQASCHYQRNELSAVVSELESQVRKPAVANAEFRALNLTILALAHQAADNYDEAQKIRELLHDLAIRTHNPYLIEISEAFAAELAVRQGRTAEALKWASQYDPEPLQPIYSSFSPTMCLAKILVLDDSADSLKRAQALLPKLEDFMAGIHNTRFLIETLALRAILSDKIGDTALATKQLGQAISLAQPGGFIRLFVDLGPELAPLLNRLEVRGEQLQYVGRILAAYRSDGGRSSTVRVDTKRGAPFSYSSGLPEPLSPREEEVLALLVERLTNKEIGEQLYISTATVKRHVHSIYEKLNVKGRREAVTKAVGLGLISA